MRNILQYPVTKDEVIQALEGAIEYELSKQLIGGITPTALIKAKEFIIRNGPDEFYEDFDPRSKEQ